MKLQYGYNIDKLNVNMKVAVFKERNTFYLPSNIISTSDYPGLIMADVMFVDENLKKIKIRVDGEDHWVNITYNDVVNFIPR